MILDKRVARDHVSRLEAAGLVQRTPMRRGDGALVMVTRKGALEAGQSARRAARSLAPTGWAHASACAWVSAWLHLRGREWVSEREILDDDFWRFDLRYQDHRGTVRRTHRPDLGVHTMSGPVAIEVELQPKAAHRLRGICWMYAQLSEDDDAPLDGVIYVTDRVHVARLVKRNAASMGLDSLSMRSLDTVIQQTSELPVAPAVDEAANAVRRRRITAAAPADAGYTRPPRYMLPSMSKHLIDLDEDALSAARAELGTLTIKDTVNQALRLATEQRRPRVIAALDTLGAADLRDRADAWR